MSQPDTAVQWKSPNDLTIGKVKRLRLQKNESNIYPKMASRSYNSKKYCN